MIPNIHSTDNDEIDLNQLARTVWRGKFWIMLTALIGVLIGGWYAYVMAVPVYTSKSTVTLESRQDQTVDIESVVTGLSGDQATINTEVEVIRSRGLLEKLVYRLNLLEDPEFNGRLRPKPKVSVSSLVAFIKSKILTDQLPQSPPSDRKVLDSVIDAVFSSISVSNIRQSYVFTITVTTQQAEKSAAMANALAELYILEQLETKFNATEQATTWLTQRVSELQVQLEEAEAKVKDFNASAQLVSPEALVGLNRQIKELRDRLKETITNKAVSVTRLQELEQAKASNDLAEMARVVNDPTLNRVLQIMQDSGDANPDTTAFEARFDQILTRAQVDVSRADQQIEALEATVKGQEQQISDQSSDLVQLQQLQREAEASRLIYEFFLGRLKETSVQQGIQQADSRMLSRAVVPHSPSAPRKSRILALSLVLGAMLGAGLVLGKELAQTTFRDVAELENHTGYTVIGQIPAIPARRRKNVLKYLTDKPTSAAAEAIRNMRTSILLSNLDHPPQIIMSTSSIPQEGKTTQSLALTQNLTGLGKRVLLIEGDIRRRVFGQYFDVTDQPGLLSVLSGDLSLADATIEIPELGADILVGEKATTNAADIFSSRRFANLLDEARLQYDYIIVDTPPVLAVPDARIIGQVVDAIIYTVKWDSTSHRQVREGLKSLEDVNIKVSGLVLSQINARQMKRYGYGDSYAAYSAYYDN
ncbi:polysaccharide biosynthesis tyrosine autokinase [Sulfitobacter sp. F26204]|uniref:GumC family protein n=1 Tax=Sulfitobacter sp. F26204 TaxID=2996014 RepID=UPI00225DD388|nr:polysaccharide biosynthesis tyrosine autokinase [Sulfitobacter sp. F26204]MCX7561616.1 polysaccharide biosynthesis tyrosine autokinase [Sulfitobacter sp. F26204]